MKVRLNPYPIWFTKETGAVSIDSPIDLDASQWADIDKRLHALRVRCNLEVVPKPRTLLLKKAPVWVRAMTFGRVTTIPIQKIPLW